MMYQVVDSCEFTYPDKWEYASAAQTAEISLPRGGETGVQVLFRGLPACRVKVNIDALTARADELIAVHVEGNPKIEPANALPHFPERWAPFDVYDCIKPAPEVFEGDCAAYIRVQAPEDVPAGIYTGKISAGEIEIPLKVHILPFALPPETLKVVQWCFNPAVIDKEACAREMRRAHQNVCLIADFDFSDLPALAKEVEFADKLGFRYFQIPCLGRRKSWKAPDILLDGRLPADSLEGYMYLVENLGRLRSFLMERNWTERFIMGVADEPNPENAAEYRALAGLIKRIFPEMKLIDAVSAGKIHGALDIYVPLNSEYEKHREAFEAYRQAGAELWHYVCCVPRESGYINRFMDMPLLAPRYLFWGNYKYGLSGYLHWAICAPQPGQNPFIQNCPEHHNADSCSILPSGDTHIVYPAPDGKPWPSMRLEAQREGCEEYEMLRLLGQRNAAMAHDILASCFKSFSNVNYDPIAFRKAKNRLLNAMCNI